MMDIKDTLLILKKLRDREKSGKLNYDIVVSEMPFPDWHHLERMGYVEKASVEHGRYVLTFLGHVVLAKEEKND